MNRRKFLSNLSKAAIMATAPAGLLPSISFAADGDTPHFFVHIQIEGSMDMIATLDPYIGELGEEKVYREYRNEDVIQAENLFLAPPAEALVKHSKDFALINGIWMSVGGLSSHEACRGYMSSGENKNSRSDTTIMPFEVAANMKTGVYDVVVNNTRETWNKRRDKITAHVLDPKDIPEVQESESMSRNDITKIFLGQVAGDATNPLNTTLNSYVEAGDATAIYAKQMNTFAKDAEVDFEHAMLSAFVAGAAYQGFFNLGGDYNGPGPGLDHHSDYKKTHAKHSKWYMEKISKIFDLFKATEAPFAEGTSMFEHTTFVVTNEFSKPAQMGYGNGKEHNTMTNTVLLAGKNVNGGQTIGRSTVFTAEEIQAAGESMSNFYNNQTALFGVPYDYASKVAPEFSDLREIIAGEEKELALIKPENVVATVRDALNIPPAGFKSVKITTQPLAAALKS